MANLRKIHTEATADNIEPWITQNIQQQKAHTKLITIKNLTKKSGHKGLMILTMVVIFAVAISKNSVFAAQRDSIKPKNANTIGNKVDGIPKDFGNDGYGYSAANSKEITNGNSSDKSVNRSGFVTSVPSFKSTLSFITLTETTTIRTSPSPGRSIAGGNIQKNVNTVLLNSKEFVEDIRSGPYFEKSASKNVTALLGKTAYLNCRVKNLGNKTMLLQVSWVRHRDIHLLTVGRYTYTSDQRFRAIHQPQTEDWILQIKYPQHRDSGIYECQVSTTPHMSHYIHLNVVEPSTEIIGAPDLYIESGSTINLTCVILNSPEPPAYIYWNHNNAIINYDSPRGGVSVVTNKGEITTSFLLIKSARPSDSGQYQCNPSNAKSKSVTVHVLNGEFPAAMQRAGQAHHRMSQSHYLLVYLFIYLFSLVSINVYAHLPGVVGDVCFAEWLY